MKAIHFPGSAPFMKKMQIGETFANAGVIAVASTTNDAGVMLSTTTNALNMVGLCTDTATYQAGQNADGSEPSGELNVIINANIVLKALMSNDGSDGTALELFDVDTATTDGLTITAADLNTIDRTDGTFWGYDGVNKGIRRKIVNTTSTTVVVGTAFPNDDVAGDRYLAANCWIGDVDSDTVTLTTNLSQVNVGIAQSAGAAELVCIEQENGTIDNEGQSNSYLHLVPADHFYASS